jgi:hypothetical protein
MSKVGSLFNYVMTKFGLSVQTWLSSALRSTPVGIIPTKLHNLLHLSTALRKKDKQRKPGNIPTNQCPFEYRGGGDIQKSAFTISKFFYLPTDEQENCFKKNIKICIKKGSYMFRCTHHYQGAYYFSLLKLWLLK